ncbi:PREDICTED: geranylgeranyl transferase type-2 subunit alpha [Pseudopodoces humilis]|uniref:geranylgeranyl transferase type-2 subunit alpha n=1 Tax=Pseudopodoces humilis TaxID=181119 RepID=UPI0006B79FA8|nr:PREDICTED: geranylgeranyl transferase type-2 subunit alpha [Pseudopodoces humilis]
MHGRLKLRPPDAARRRQREEKLRHYREAMDALLGGAPPAQVLSLSAAVLAANPDVGTCWNLRRRALGALGGDWVPSELAFVGQCLGVNPKSYGAWHHRSWVLARAAAPPAGREDLALCERLLAADSRNFHAWDHRRAVARDPEAELAFTGSLLSRDFSNFSAWHQRLRLLAPARERGGAGAGALPPAKLREELELVQNAVFTDPTDQSAWVYLRCILSRAPPPPRVICVHIDREDATVAVIFSRPVRVNPECPELTATLDGSALTEPWRSGEGRPRPSHTWLCALPALPSDHPAHLEVTWAPDSTPRDVRLLPGEAQACWQEPIVERELFWPELGVAEAQVLQDQVQMCRELLELEPQSRGCLLTLALLLAALDPRGHAREIREHLRSLQEADPLRSGFVADVRSRFEVALAILGAGEGLSLPAKELTAVPLLERMAALARLDLAGNELRELPAALGALRSLTELDLSDNRVSKLGSAPPLPRLRLLRLDRNPIGHASALTPLAAWPRLALLGLAETPLGSAPDGPALLAELLPAVDVTFS